MIRFKENVILHKDGIYITDEIINAIVLVSEIYRNIENKDLVVTSVFDGTHKVNSKHYVGKAFDCRSKSLKNPFLAFEILKEEFEKRYPGKYRVLYEYHGTPNAHFHIQTVM